MAGWPVRLVLVRATPSAEVYVISVQRCKIAWAIFPWVSLSRSDCSFLLIFVDNYLNGLVTSYLCFFLRIPTDGFDFLLTRVRFGSLNRCGVLKQRYYFDKLFDNPHLDDTLPKKAPIWSRHHETPQFYKSSACEPSVLLQSCIEKLCEPKRISLLFCCCRWTLLTLRYHTGISHLDNMSVVHSKLKRVIPCILEFPPGIEPSWHTTFLTLSHWANWNQRLIRWSTC